MLFRILLADSKDNWQALILEYLARLCFPLVEEEQDSRDHCVRAQEGAGLAV